MEEEDDFQNYLYDTHWGGGRLRSWWRWGKGKWLGQIHGRITTKGS
jgi:hypothetical protein